MDIGARRLGMRHPALLRTERVAEPEDRATDLWSARHRLDFAGRQPPAPRQAGQDITAEQQQHHPQRRTPPPADRPATPCRPAAPLPPAAPWLSSAAAPGVAGEGPAAGLGE